MRLPNIEYREDLTGIVAATDDYYSGISYIKTLEDFEDHASYSKFISGIEKVVRTHEDYTTFIGYIKNIVGVKFCQVFSELHETDNVSIECHHGPIFTLYDICEVILNWFLRTGQRINSFTIANQVLEEHFKLRVGVVMLSVTAHEMAHNRDLFLNINQTIGNVDSFIKLYSPYFTEDQKYKLWSYLNLCKDNPSFDRGILDLDHIEKIVKDF